MKTKPKYGHYPEFKGVFRDTRNNLIRNKKLINRAVEGGHFQTNAWVQGSWFKSKFTKTLFKTNNLSIIDFTECEWRDLLLVENKFQSTGFDGCMFRDIKEFSGRVADSAFIRCQFQNIVFRETVFSGVVFTKCSFNNCEFIDCTFRHSTGRKTGFNGCVLSSSFMPDSDDRKIKFTRCIFDPGVMGKINFALSFIKGMEVYKGNWAGLDTSDLKKRGAKLLWPEKKEEGEKRSNRLLTPVVYDSFADYLLDQEISIPSKEAYFFQSPGLNNA